MEKPNIVNNALKLVIFMIVDLANIAHQYSVTNDDCFIREY